MEISQLKQIYQLMSSNDFDEIELRFGDIDRVKMTRSINSSRVTVKSDNIKTAETIIQNDRISDSLSDSNKTEIFSELVGVFQFMDEDENFFPKVGDEVVMGEKLGKILSLNSIKEIKSPIDGHISEIAVKKDDIVDYGRLLFVIEEQASIKA